MYHLSRNTYHILKLTMLRIAKIIWRTLKDTENSWKNVQVSRWEGAQQKREWMQTHWEVLPCTV